MKKVIMIILTIIIAIAISAGVVYIHVFSENARKEISKKEENLINNEIKKEENKYESRIKEIESNVEKDIQNGKTMEESEIQTAISYIEENIEKMPETLDTETIEKIAYYGAYLAKMAKYETEEKNEITILGENTIEFAKEALKYINNKTKNESENTQEETTIPENTLENIISNTVSEEQQNSTGTIMEENNTIQIDTKIILEETKTKVKESLNKVNVNKENLIKEYIEKI